MDQAFGLWSEEGEPRSGEQEGATNLENAAPLQAVNGHVSEELEWRPAVAQSEEGEPGSGGEEETLNPENGTPLEVADSTVLEDDDLCKLDACFATGQKAFERGDYSQAERLLQEGIVLAADMHFDDFRLQTVKSYMWAELHRRLSFLKLSQMDGRSSVDKVMTSSSTWGFGVDGNLVKSD
ncbi:hypothetical protein LSAT2_017144 [Lamellibrachia satsuma]|nr:hypothetical protein LSAT2_017144 [Lamellibrachia satsuma]